MENQQLEFDYCPSVTENESENGYEIAKEEIYRFIRDNYEGEVIRDHKGITTDGDPLGVYIPSLNLAFDYDGLYCNNEINKPSRNYHLYRTRDCSMKGIRLIHIFEDEWLNKKDIVKSRILNLIGKSETKIYARNCDIRCIDASTANEFLMQCHIQGKCGSKVRYGLYYNKELVALMTFGLKRKNLGSKNTEGCYELIRYCSRPNSNVVGGASRLFAHFLEIDKPKYVLSYADRRWSNGNLYEKLGFKMNHISQPCYFYVIDGRRYNRFNFRKDLLIKDGFDGNMTEHEIMLSRKIYRIYDCGCFVYEYEPQNAKDSEVIPKEEKVS